MCRQTSAGMHPGAVPKPHDSAADGCWAKLCAALRWVLDASRNSTLGRLLLWLPLLLLRVCSRCVCGGHDADDMDAAVKDCRRGEWSGFVLATERTTQYKEVARVQAVFRHASATFCCCRRQCRRWPPKVPDSERTKKWWQCSCRVRARGTLRVFVTSLTHQGVSPLSGEEGSKMLTDLQPGGRGAVHACVHVCVCDVFCVRVTLGKHARSCVVVTQFSRLVDVIALTSCMLCFTFLGVFSVLMCVVVQNQTTDCW